MIEILEIYQILLNKFGHQNWWPADTRDEIIIGAILTQSVNWQNVDKALNNLKQNSLLSLEALHNATAEDIAPLIIPTLYYNVKARKLKNFSDFLYGNYEGDLDKLLSLPLPELRKVVLSINGIGEETADCILLYAANKLSFVIDAYTKRIFHRLGYTDSNISYGHLQKFITEIIPLELDLYQDFHAQLVMLGKDFCKPKPKCEECPLGGICEKRIE